MKREKKQRYLDNLMDKAGELSLRCKFKRLYGYKFVTDESQFRFWMHRGTGRPRRDGIRSPSCVGSMTWT